MRMHKRNDQRCLGRELCSVVRIHGGVGPFCPFHDAVEDALQTVARWRKLSLAKAGGITFVGPDGIGSSISLPEKRGGW